jgi:hypothetical protein
VTRTQEELEDESKSDKVESEEKEFPDKQSNASTERESYMKKSLFLEQSRMRGKKRGKKEGGKKKEKKKREREKIKENSLSVKIWEKCACARNSNDERRQNGKQRL